MDELGMTAISLHIKSPDEETREHREEIARRVREYFIPNLPSEFRVLCYLDDIDICWLKERWGGHSNRGVHWPIRGQGLAAWPQDMWNTIAPIDPQSGEISWPYTSVVYLHGSTCGSDVQLAMTLSHELQHFLQFVTDKQLWAIHTLLTELPNLPTHNLKHWFDLPNEREARIVAKRIAENLFGRAVVDQHIVKMMASRISEEDAADWEFIQKIDPSRNYDLRQNTIPLVDEYRQELEKLRTQFAGDADLGAADLDL
jgi:hypothetical protein